MPIVEEGTFVYSFIFINRLKSLKFEYAFNETILKYFLIATFYYM